MRKHIRISILPIFLLILGLGSAKAQNPTDSLGGRTVHVFLPSTAIDTLIIQNLNIRMTKDAPFWYTYTFTKAGLYDYQDGFYFTDPSHRLFFSKAGLGSTEAPRFLLADFKGAKEIWVVVDPAGPPTAKPVILYSAPRMVYVLNPWFTTGPKMVSGTKSYGMSTVDKHCGWFSAMLLDTTVTSIHFSEINNTESYGKSGLGKTDNFDLGPLFEAHGPAIYLNTNTNAWTATLPPNTDQECGYLMAATVRDFSALNADFDFGSAISGDFSLRGAVQNAIGADRKPVRSTTPGTVKGLNIFNDFDSWWKTSDPSAPPEKRNYESCTDIPMSKTSDGLWEYDSYKDSPDHGFWPLEKSANPFTDSKASCYVKPPPDSTTWVMNGPNRNGNYCMESHASFIYNKGQKFAFRGDDDVWVFINDKLVVDLGGIHTPKSDSVDLDKLGLVEGSTYKWDFFYCDRQPCGSSLRIKTSIFFKQQKSLYGKDVPGTTPGTVGVEIWKLQGGKGSCASISDTAMKETKATGLNYQVLDATGKVVLDLKDGSQGTYNTGIFIDNAKSTMSVDSEKVTGLPAGKYKVIAFEPSNQNLHVDLPFTIPVRDYVDFDSPATATAPVGTLIMVIASHRDQAGAKASGIMTYTPSFPPGLEVYGAADRTLPVKAGDLLSTAATGFDTLWVTGTATATTDKTYNLTLPTPAKLSPALTFTVPTDRVEFVPPLSRDTLVGKIVAIDLQAVDKAGPQAKAVTYQLKIPAGLKVYSDAAGTQPTTGGTTGVDGKARIYATADSTNPVDQTYILSITTSTPTMTLKFRMPPIDIPKAVSAGIYDTDGNGRGDSIHVVYDKSVSASPPNATAFKWPSSAAQIPVTGVASGTALIIRDTTSPFLTSGTGTFLTTYRVRNADSIQAIPLDDHIGPVIKTAIITLGKTEDTLRITFSEPISASGPSGDPSTWFGFKRTNDGLVELIAPVGSPTWKDDRSEITLVYSNTNPNVPRAGNLVRIEDGKTLLTDERGNTSGPSPRFRGISGGKRSKILSWPRATLPPPVANEPIVAPFYESSGADPKEVVERRGRIGHLLKFDLGTFTVGEDFNPIPLSEVFLEYHVDYFTNLGMPVADAKGKVACNDPIVFQGDCTVRRGSIFLGWNGATDKGTKVGTGAYVARISYAIKAGGKVVDRNDQAQVWGVIRKQ